MPVNEIVFIHVHVSFSFVRITALLVSCPPDSAQCQNHAFLCSMPRSCYHCPRAGTGKLGFPFVRITALLVACRPNSAQYARIML
jgi:hypothetical protein